MESTVQQFSSALSVLVCFTVSSCHYNTMDNHNEGHSLSSDSSHRKDEYAFYEHASNRERELQEQLDAAKKELEEKRESVVV